LALGPGDQEIGPPRPRQRTIDALLETLRL
jgi:hypothetical protein